MRITMMVRGEVWELDFRFGRFVPEAIASAPLPETVRFVDCTTDTIHINDIDAESSPPMLQLGDA